MSSDEPPGGGGLGGCSRDAGRPVTLIAEPGEPSTTVTTPTAFVVLVLLAVGVGLPLCWGRVLAGHDIVTYLINAQQTAANLREGALFPAWGGGFNAGFGSPALLFYPPVTSYVHALPVLAGLPIVAGVSVLALLAHALSGLAVWAWLSSIGLRRGALPAAAVYMIAPYRFIDLYLRSALSEHWAFIWPPLILLVASTNRMRGGLRVPLLAFSVAALLLTNLPLAVLFGIGLGFWFMVSDRILGRRVEVVLGCGLGFFLAAFQLVPQALSSSLLDLDRFYGPSAGKFRPSANTLFSSGFGEWNLDMEFSLCLLATFAVVVFAFVLLVPAERAKWGPRLTILAGFGCVVVATGPAGPIWDALPVVSHIQFPWRITAVLTLLASAMVARLETRRAVVVVLMTMALAVPFANWDRSAVRTYFDPPKPLPAAPGSIFPDPHDAWEAGSEGWYWRHHTLAEIWLIPKATGPAFFAELAGEHPPEYDAIRQRPAVLLEGPSAPVQVLSWGQSHRTVAVDAPFSGTLLWRVISFTGMEVRVDGKEMALASDRPTGLVTCPITAGRHQVDWCWRPFPGLLWARWVSTLVALSLLVGLLWSVRSGGGWAVTSRE